MSACQCSGTGCAESGQVECTDQAVQGERHHLPGRWCAHTNSWCAAFPQPQFSGWQRQHLQFAPSPALRARPAQDVHAELEKDVHDRTCTQRSKDVHERTCTQRSKKDVHAVHAALEERRARTPLPHTHALSLAPSLPPSLPPSLSLSGSDVISSTHTIACHYTSRQRTPHSARRVS
jgi:hypothetical protein